ncbi:MAG: class I SAM-dependent methyltransferase [Burkholderiaceae bacterium]|nr:class I SAM-dependent methyltransferase [Burkholderiaceae bacterium]
MNADKHWVRWGELEPYFAVITDPRFRRQSLTDEARRAFFDSGRHHARHLLASCRQRFDPGFAPRRVLDFGCGVGRVALPLAECVDEVVGVDVSPAMLEEARRNQAAAGLTNLTWLLSDDQLSRVHGHFDMVHSCITFQHIEIPRGRQLFARLLERLTPGGIAAIQITYAKLAFADSFGQPPRRMMPSVPLPAPGVDPEMQMNPYALGELAFLLQQRGMSGFYADFTDHGGELGVFLFAQAAGEKA